MALSFGKRENESQPTPVRPLGAAPAASPVQPLGSTRCRFTLEPMPKVNTLLCPNCAVTTSQADRDRKSVV